MSVEPPPLTYRIFRDWVSRCHGVAKRFAKDHGQASAGSVVLGLLLIGVVVTARYFWPKTGPDVFWTVVFFLVGLAFFFLVYLAGFATAPARIMEADRQETATLNESIGNTDALRATAEERSRIHDVIGRALSNRKLIQVKSDTRWGGPTGETYRDYVLEVFESTRPELAAIRQDAANCFGQVPEREPSGEVPYVQSLITDLESRCEKVKAAYPLLPQ